jgi:hypothetical protein
MVKLINHKALSLKREAAANAGMLIALESAGGFTMNREI